MKTIFIVIGLLVACFLALVIITASPLVGEVVTLHTRDAGGDWQTTPLWIADLEGGSYLRGGSPDESGWITRLRANPEAQLDRAGQLRAVTLVEQPARLQEVHDAMAEKYGWADGFVNLLTGDRSQDLPLRVKILPAVPNPN
jgi:hypothetical protein